MTEKTLAAVQGEARRVLAELPEVHKRREEVARQFEVLELSPEAELKAVEILLVTAKVKLVEARCDLPDLIHKLFYLTKAMAHPEQAHTSGSMSINAKQGKADKELRAMIVSLDTMAHKPYMRQNTLKRYRPEK